MFESHGPRQRDRRQAFADLLVALTSVLQRRQDALLLRRTFEEMTRRLVPARTIHLRDATSRWGGRGEERAGEELIALQVPGDGATHATLEATFEPSRVGDWDVQTLGAAAHVAALIIEIERLRRQLQRHAAVTHAARPTRDAVAPLIGSTPIMLALRSTIERVAATEFTILIEGESGVGKELVARQIHELSRRRDGPFVAINCAALVETLLEAELFGIEERTATGVRGRRGKFEAADGGTLFLDEVSDLSATAQAKLLRSIQDLAVERVGGNGLHRVDIRIIAATNRPLSEAVARHLFRPDLFYRLSGVDLRVPTLRERRADIIELAEYFLARHCATHALHLSPIVKDALLAYDWPGNVRELERVMERVITLTDTDAVELDDLPPSVRGWHAEAIAPSLGRNDTLRVWVRRYARLMLAQCGGNKRKTARVLDISHHTLMSYLRAPLPGISGNGTASESAGRAVERAESAPSQAVAVIDGVDTRSRAAADGGSRNNATPVFSAGVGRRLGRAVCEN